MISISLSATEVDLENSSFQWKGTKVTGQHIGKISLKSAKLKEEKGQVKDGTFVMDMQSITVDDIKSKKWEKKFLKHMKDEDFFLVGKFPTAKLVIEKLEKGKASGKLTIKEKTQPVTFDVKHHKAKKIYSGTLKFDRTKFGIVYGSGNFFKNLGDKVIHDEVTLKFNVKLK